MRLQSIIRAIYPPQCVSCDAGTEAEHGLCSTCWPAADFIAGAICDSCGAPLPGGADDHVAQCDDCIQIARPWDRGRAVLTYQGAGRRLVLALKHGDRTDLVPTLARWMVQKVVQMQLTDPVLVPVPLHWTRLVRRRYNQSAMLSLAMAKLMWCDVCVDALSRPKRTAALDGHPRDARFATLADALAVNPDRVEVIRGRQVVLVDDVMTSGATLAAATEALRSAGPANVSIVTLARVVKGD